MCLTKNPKPSEPVGTTTPKVPVYLHNRWLDGLGINAEARGRNSLRIDRGSPAATPTPSTPPPIFIPPIRDPGDPLPPGGRPGGGGPGNRWRLGIN